jgi:myo-inositol 2-dehydrogenase/D-chiro-inositol 1-dehydrogenase
MSGRGSSVRFGVIGCGVIAYWTHLRLLRNLPGATLVAAADPDPAARERAAKLTGVPAYADPAELLGRDDIDAVVISAPSALHAELGIQSAQAGKHFYLEKPLASNRAEAEALCAAADAAKVAASLGFNRRFHPLSLQARALITSGRLGAARAVLSAFNEPLDAETMPPWKQRRESGGGVLLDLASHHFDLIPWLLGDEIASLRADVRSRQSEQDEASVFATSKAGVPFQSHFSFRAARADFVEVILERGKLRLDRHRPTLNLQVSRRLGYGVRASFVAPTRETLRFQAMRALRPSYDPSYRAALLGFIEAIRTGASAGATLADGRRNLESVLACEESARTGGAAQRPAL